jgi:exodeoxyribonuclease V beta subunit
VARREIAKDWWVYSYSMLAREQRAEAEVAPGELGAEDEIGSHEAAPVARERFAGARFGNSLHAALEKAHFERWRDWRDPLPPPGEQGAIDKALSGEGFGGDADLEAGRLVLTRLIAATLNAPMPEGTRLCQLAPHARRDELEFHLSLAPVAIPALLALLHAHGIVAERQVFGARRRIEGLLTGRIDLVYAHADRHYVLDYKSNLLADYSPDALEHAIRASEYDLQYVLYTLALHRWLRFRLGSRYDYDRHFGGVRYVFCRGLELDGDPRRGIHVARPSRELIESLDALFAGSEADAA